MGTGTLAWSPSTRLIALLWLMELCVDEVPGKCHLLPGRPRAGVVKVAIQGEQVPKDLLAIVPSDGVLSGG